MDEIGEDIQHWELRSVSLELPERTPLEGRWRLVTQNRFTNATEHDVFWEFRGENLHWYKQHYENGRRETIRRFTIGLMRLEGNVLDLETRSYTVQTLAKLENDRLLILLHTGMHRSLRPVSWYDRRGNQLLEFHREPEEDI